jgi:hypothetical protein
VVPVAVQAAVAMVKQIWRVRVRNLWEVRVKVRGEYVCVEISGYLSLQHLFSGPYTHVVHRRMGARVGNFQLGQAISPVLELPQVRHLVWWVAHEEWPWRLDDSNGEYG